MQSLQILPTILFNEILIFSKKNIFYKCIVRILLFSLQLSECTKRKNPEMLLPVLRERR